ncbi:MAG: ABC transporter permease [Corynebacterium sp.]|nr:ABC transporter permease [Corynebacterium sp.]
MSTDTAAKEKEQIAQEGVQHDQNHRAQDTKKSLIIILGLPIVVALMLLAFLAPTLNSGAKDLPLAIAGPDATVAQMEGAIGEHTDDAGNKVFEVQTYADDAAVQDAIMSGDAIGGIVLNPTGIEVYTASGAGAVYGNLLTALGQGLEAQGQVVHYTDVAPRPAADPNGVALSTLALPLAFGGMVAGVAISLVLSKRYGLKMATVLAYSLLAGFVLTAVVQICFDALDGNFWRTSLALSLGIAAISAFVVGCHSLLGAPGIALGAVLMIFISNPLSGLANGWKWLPEPWGMIGQFMPIGATGNRLRSIVYFDGRADGFSIWVLLAWLLVGLCLIGAKWYKHNKEQRVAVAQ